MSKLTCFSKWVLFNLALFLNFNLYLSLPENHFGDCLPKKCGNININFPFRIIEQQKSYCGFPGFDVICKNNKLVYFNISGSSYVIKNISYEKQTFQVVSSVIHDKQSCFGAIHHLNLTLNNAFFNYAANYSEILLLLNCPQKLLSEKRLQNSEICGAIAVYEDEAKIEDLEGKCNGFVSVAYEGWSENVSSIREKLEQGFSLKWTGKNCSACIETGGQCGYDQGVSDYGCYCPDRTHSYHCVPDPVLPTKTGTRQPLPLILGSVIGVIILMFGAALLAICWYRKKHSSPHSKFVSETASLERSGSDVEKGSVYFGVPLFTYSELKEATDSFDQSRELGDGGFGTVYYGKLRDGREVAVKRLYEKNYRRVEQFMNEVQILTCLRHQNLVSLYGCTSCNSKELLLVYEFVPNGTVADHLYGEKANNGPLPWSSRLKIAIETASALGYLHASDIVHRDVKTHNILLDSNCSVKVADFGLSRLFPSHVSHISTAPQGTPGYLDPEYNQCYQLTDKSDVYSFGVVLVELISSLPAVDMSRHRHEINLSNYAMTRIQRCAFDELVDPALGYHSDFKVKRMTTAVGELAFQCLQHDKEFRPSMEEILVVLRSIENMNYEELETEELARSGSAVQGSKPPLSPVEDDHAKLLSAQPPHPSSPISVMHDWASKSTTPSSSK